MGPVCSSLKGYVMGGATATYKTVIDGIQFSDESSFTAASALSSGRKKQAGVFSSSKGYALGGVDVAEGNTAEIVSLQFSDDSVAVSGAAISVARATAAGVQS